MKPFFLRQLLVALAMCCLAIGVVANETLWSIGQPDEMSIEFAPGAREQVNFVVGQNATSRDFPGHQNGTHGTRNQPYTVVFDLKDSPSGNFELALDLIFRAGAPREMKVNVNGRQGIFPIRLTAYKNNASKKEGNDMLLAKQHLVVPIEAHWLKSKENRIALLPVGIGALDYDAIIFRKVSEASAEKLRIEPSIFFRRNGGELVEICELAVPFTKKFHNGKAVVRLGRETFMKSFTNSLFDFGVMMERIEIPASARSGIAEIELSLDSTTQKTSCDFKPAKQWKVFICPKVHNDVGYTDLQPHVNELDNRNTDTVLDILEKYPFYKFNFETSWLVDNYLDCRPEERREDFLYLAKRNRAAINGLYLNLMTGVCSGEELYRALYFTHRLHREHGCNFDFACLTDAPSHSWFLPTLLSDVGIKAFSNGSNQTRAPILHQSNLNEDSPFYWEGMNGERIMMWYAHSYRQLVRLTGPDVGIASSLEYMQATVPQFLIRYLRDDYAPDAAMIYGAYVDNAAIPKTAEAPLIEQWNKEFEFPKLVVASDADYFNYIEKNFAGKLPVYRGDCGAYWEDGVASTAKATTLNRQTQQIIPAAETAATLATIFDPKNRYPAEDFCDAWKNVMFYDEHTWGAHNSIAQPDREFVTRQWEIKEDYATRANLDARNLLARANNRLCQQIAVDGSSIIAFNWQNWPRSGVLEAEIEHNQQLVELSSSKTVAADVVHQQDGYKRVRFIAQEVPAMGYKTFAIRGGVGGANEKLSGEMIESKFYRLTIHSQTGAVKSLFDKTENRELADAKAPYKLNEYLYVSGGENSSIILNHNFGTPPANLIVNQPTTGKVIECVKTPLGQRIVVETKSKNTPLVRSEYLVYDSIRRVDIINTVEKDETRAKEAVYFAFPFAAEKPTFEYQIQNGWVRPNDDQMPGACREWFTPQNLVHVSDGDFSVAWSTPDAPLACFTDINLGKWLTHLPITNGHVYSYVMNNYWFTNYRAQQGGKFRFRYFITSGKDLSREALAQFDADTRTPVFAYPFLSSFSAHIAQADRPMPAAAGSFANLGAPNLQMVTFKAAEDCDGYILRIREIAGRAGEAELKLPNLRVKSAQLCNGVEDNKQKLLVANDAVKVPFKPNQFITVRLKVEAAPHRLAGK